MALNALTKLGPNSLPPKLSLDELNVTGITTSGHVNVSGVTTSGAFKGPLEGSVTGGNIAGNSTGLTGSPNIVVGTVNASGTITGNVTGDLTGNADTATNASGLSGSPNISVTDISCSNVSASSSVTATTFHGDGSLLTGIEAASGGELPSSAGDWLSEIPNKKVLSDDTTLSATDSLYKIVTKIPMIEVSDTKTLTVSANNTFIIGVYGIV